MIEGIILGIMQGITEWLPVSSEGVLTLISLKFLEKDLASSVSMAVFLHLGTFLAALIYFRKDIFNLFANGNKLLLRFFILATLVTGIIGIPILFFVSNYFGEVSARLIIIFIGVMLLVTGLVQLKKPSENFRELEDLKTTDSIIVGGLQGLASLPGLSRSGLTIAGLLFRKFNETTALKISFLMSLPAVLGGNIFLSLIGLKVEINSDSLVALTVSFIVGLLTIWILLKISQKINFGWFAVLFGALTLASVWFF